MEIKIQYSVSQAKHSFQLDKTEIDNMKNLESVVNTPKGKKSIEINGTKEELLAFAEKIKEFTKQ